MPTGVYDRGVKIICGHPDRKHRGHGLCNACYLRKKRKENPRPKSKPKKSTVYNVDFPKGFYVYVWLREDGSPYYVGKGQGRRGYIKATHRFPPPTSVDRIIIQEYETEEDALLAEKFLVEYYGRENRKQGTLLNLTDGGEKVPPPARGIKRSEETKKKISEALKGNTNGSFTAGKPWTDEHREKHKKAMKNRNIPPESRLKMGSNRGKTMSKENLSALIAVNTGRVVSEETKNKISLANTGKTRNEETKSKLREAWVRRRKREQIQ